MAISDKIDAWKFHWHLTGKRFLRGYKKPIDVAPELNLFKRLWMATEYAISQEKPLIDSDRFE